MLDQLATSAEDVGPPGHARFHPVQHGLVLEPRDVPVTVCRASWTQHAYSTRLPVGVVDPLQTPLNRPHVRSQALASWAEDGVALWVIAKLVFAKQTRSDRRTTLWAGNVWIHPGL